MEEKDKVILKRGGRIAVCLFYDLGQVYVYAEAYMRICVYLTRK